MSTTLWRWLLSPRTSWHAWRAVRASGGDLSFDAAWRQTRVQLHPDEADYRAAGHRPDGALRAKTTTEQPSPIKPDGP
ncbi:hypothetical protein ACFCYH_34395 [Streptomyces sp. NPDC056400]|uniref:hypothetical protein n=1 Tax=Streptomyces sp. NPDC056400 TaxID=3345808 RepID=UPI0035D89813